MYSSGPSYLATTLRVIGVHLTARFDGKTADEGEITDWLIDWLIDFGLEETILKGARKLLSYSHALFKLMFCFFLIGCVFMGRLFNKIMFEIIHCIVFQSLGISHSMCENIYTEYAKLVPAAQQVLFSISYLQQSYSPKLTLNQMRSM